MSGDVAYAWTHLVVTMHAAGEGGAMRRSGHTLSIFRKTADGRWILSRDANMLTVER